MNSSDLDLQNVVNYLPHLPSPKQRALLRYGCVEGLYGGAAGGGKSDYLLMAALQGIQIPGYSALLLRRTFQDLSLPGALMDRSHEWWSKTDAHWNGETKTWTFPSGARITFGYMDGRNDHLRCQSAEFQYVGFDECSHFEEQQALYMLSRLRAPIGFPAWLGCRWRAATNPGGIGHEWIQKRYRIPSEGTTKILSQRDSAGKIVRIFVPALAIDNPGLNVSEYLAKLDLLDPLTRAQLREGKWLIDSTGLVYYCYNENCNVDRLPADIKSSEWRYVLGADYGSMNDKCAFAVCAYSAHEPEVYLVKTEEHSRMSPSDAARRIQELTEEFGDFEFMVGDQGGLGAAYHLEFQRHFSIPMQAAEKTNKLGFIKLFNGELANGRLKVIPQHCETWVNQAKLLLWSDSQRQKENQSQHNDSCDAALYCVRACRHYGTNERQVDPSAIAIEEMAKRDPEGAEWMQELLDEHRKREWEAGAGWGSVQPWG